MAQSWIHYMFGTSRTPLFYNVIIETHTQNMLKKQTAIKFCMRGGGGVGMCESCYKTLLTISDSYKEQKHLDKLFY
jgi:hypothetical protein